MRGPGPVVGHRVHRPIGHDNAPQSQAIRHGEAGRILNRSLSRRALAFRRGQACSLRVRTRTRRRRSHRGPHARSIRARGIEPEPARRARRSHLSTEPQSFSGGQPRGRRRGSESAGRRPHREPQPGGRGGGPRRKQVGGIQRRRWPRRVELERFGRFRVLGGPWVRRRWIGRQLGIGVQR